MPRGCHAGLLCHVPGKSQERAGAGAQGARQPLRSSLQVLLLLLSSRELRTSQDCKCRWEGWCV